MPVAAAERYRLSDDAPLLWVAFERLHHKHGLPGELEIPMESFVRAVELVLKDSMLRDATGHRPDAATWNAAAPACGYIQTLRAISVSVWARHLDLTQSCRDHRIHGEHGGDGLEGGGSPFRLRRCCCCRCA